MRSGSAPLRGADVLMRNVRRFLLGELDGAIAKLESGDVSDRDVHAIRKALKRVRAALRLLRPSLGSAAYRRENAVVRDVARPLTRMRDAAILPQTLRRLQARPGAEKALPREMHLSRVLRQERRSARRQLEPRELKAAARSLA